MAFSERVSNPSSQDYDYQSGRGLDSFMSASLGEVSWETSLGAYYNTLSYSPIGQSNSTAINFDSSQVTGSVGNSITVGGDASAGGGGTGGGSGGGNIIIDGVKGVIKILDSNGNVVGQIGNLGT